jgi:hypothetical protein
MTSYASWDAIGELARLAPTPHNTQPYRIRPRSEREAELVLLCDRLLPDEDRGNLYVLAAFGVFQAALERAGRACGFAVTVTARDELDGASLVRTSGSVVVGTARLEPSKAPHDPTHASLLALRRTSRLPYHERSIGADTLHELGRVARTADHTLVVVSEPAFVRHMLERNAHAIVDNLQDPREREEIRGWHRLGATPATGDGLWQRPMNQPAWQLKAAFTVPWLFAVEPVRSLAITRYLKTQRGTRHIAFLDGAFTTWPELVAAGRMLFELWLAMAAADVYMHPFGSLLTNPRHAAWVAQQTGLERVWLLMRLGFSDQPPAAPRLASIVLA